MSYPYASYVDDVEDLAKSDPGFEYLHTFLTGKAREGSAIACLYVCDLIQGKFVKQSYPVVESGDLQNVQQAVHRRPPDSSARLVLLGYGRISSASGSFLPRNETSRKLLDFMGWQYDLHPDMLRLHYFDPSAPGSRPAAQALVIQRPFRKPSMLRLEGRRNTMLSAQLCQDGPFKDHTTLFVLVSQIDVFDHWIPYRGGVFSDMKYGVLLDIFNRWDALNRLDDEAIESAALHPSDLAIPFAQLFAQLLVEAIESVSQRIMGEPGTGSQPKSLGEAYHDYLKYLEHLRNACASLKQFGGDSPSDRFKALLENYQEIFNAYDWKLGGINQLVNYRATAASLEAAEASLEESRRGIEQNNKVKKLTQLAFVFIPLSFVTGAFGMNLNVLNTGSATIWQVVVGTLAVYALVATIWGLQELFQRMKPKFIEKSEENRERILMREGLTEEAMRGHDEA